MGKSKKYIAGAANALYMPFPPGKINHFSLLGSSGICLQIHENGCCVWFEFCLSEFTQYGFLEAVVPMKPEPPAVPGEPMN
jgi:hypothetical protein